MMLSASVVLDAKRRWLLEAMYGASVAGIFLALCRQTVLE